MELNYILNTRNYLKESSMAKGGAPAKSQAQIDAEKAQQKELEDLQKKEDARVAAMSRKRQGRASLISGSETGQAQDLKTTLGS